MKRNLTQYLSKGQENAIPARELVQLLHYDTIRDVSKEINRLRTNGEIICSSTLAGSGGYYLPNDISDIKAFCRQMRHRIKEIDRAVKPAEELLEKIGGE